LSIPLKINIFAWKLFLNRVPIKDNLVRRHIIALTDHKISAGCGLLENKYNLFVICYFYGRLWSLVSCWLGFSTTTHGNLLVQYYITISGLGHLESEK